MSEKITTAEEAALEEAVEGMRERHDGTCWCMDDTHWLLPLAETQAARLRAVLAECDRADADPLRPRQVHIDRIRRAATGGTP